MSKQSTLAGFLNKTSIGNNNATKSKGFSYVKPPNRKQNEITSNENKSLNSLKSSFLTDKKDISNCIEISDDERISSPKKDPITLPSVKKDDSFMEFTEDELIFTKVSTNSKSKLTIEDIYAKYGSPEKKQNVACDSSNKSEDLFDIDKSLSSNPSYVAATKKLSQNLLQLDASKPVTDPPAKSKFKFNVRSSSKSTNSADTTVTTNSNNIAPSSFIGVKNRTETVSSKNQDTQNTSTSSNTLNRLNSNLFSANLTNSSLNASTKTTEKPM